MSEHDPRGNDETAPIQPQPEDGPDAAPAADQHEAPEPVEATAEQPVPGEAVAGPPVGPAAAAPTKARWRDRSWPLPAVVVVALVAVVLGGIGGAALAATSNHEDVRRGPGFGRFHGGPGMVPPGMGGRPGQRWRFHDPYGSGQRQWGQQQQPQGPNGPLTPNGGSAPSPATPSPSA
ncbi:MAG: hypothetical protein JOZ82_04500 [Marmoricola sp.]|nr:hypothetical protein [Marmoricola sp.]